MKLDTMAITRQKFIALLAFDSFLYMRKLSNGTMTRDAQTMMNIIMNRLMADDLTVWPLICLTKMMN